MLKYRGQYRILYDLDKQGKPCEFIYIPCGIHKGSNICRHDSNTLNAYITSSIVANNLLRDHHDLFGIFQMGDSEATLLFPESRMEEAAIILKAKVLGKNLGPRPKRKVVISEDRKKILSERMRQMKANCVIIEEKVPL